MTRARDLADSADKDIAGTLTVDSFAATSKSTITVDDNAAALELISTDTDNSEGPQFQLIRDSNSPAINDWLGVIKFRGKNNADESTNFFEIGSRSFNVADGNETGYLRFLQTVGGTQYNVFTLNDTEAVFNEEGLNKDFRVESTSNQNMLFVDGGSDKVGIGTGGVLQSKLHVFSGDSGASVSSSAKELFVEDGGDSGITIGSGNASSGSLRFADDGGTGRGIVIYNHSTDALSLHADGSERFKVDATGATVTSGTLTTPSVTTNEIRGNSNIVSYHADYDASSSGNQGHLFFANNSDNSYGGFFNNDFYIQDNLSVGRYYRADGTNEYNTDGTSAVTVYSSDSTTGPATYKNYTQLVSRNSTDPDYGLVMATSANVESETLDTTESDQMAFVLDNGGRIWAWGSHYAGRTRRGDSTTTTNYRVGDHGFTGYSNTGGTHGESSYNGFTQISGRETPNSDNVFRVSVAGSDRIHFYANGNGYFDGGADLGNADYAEYFEWADGNPDNEDRRGYSVVVTTDGKMRIATSEDDTADFLGIVSVHAAICGDAAPMSWQGKYQLDKFGGRVLVDINHTCWMNKPDGEHDDSDQWDHKYTDEYISSNNIAVPDYAKVITTQVPVESDGYEQDREYIPRKDRKEWQAIGLMGKLPLLKGQPTAPQWRKLFDLNDEVEMWLVR